MFPDLSLVVPCAGTTSPAIEQGSVRVAVPPSLPPPLLMLIGGEGTATHRLQQGDSELY